MVDALFRDAIAFAQAHPTRWPHDVRQIIEGGTFDAPPWNVVKGPVRRRGHQAGSIRVGGRLLAAWGECDRADMIFSVTKSYIGLLAAIALDHGLIRDVADPVSRSIRHPAFAAHNRDVTWLQLLQQTSEWQGTLWGVPDTVDRDRQLAPTDDPARFDRKTPHGAPGSYWDYNDVRVNALCLALTLAFRRSLRDVLGEQLFAGTEAADWSWDGYGAQSAVSIDGGMVPVVVGGGHWGGGLATSVRLDERLGQTVARDGLLDGRRIASTAALAMLKAPCALQPIYGGLWWLNDERRLYPAASAASVFALGVGLNAIWVDPERDLVAVVHWIDEAAFASFVEQVAAALQ